MTQSPETKDRKNGLVLVVDDMLTNREILAACLSDEFAVITAKDGYECLKLARKIPDLILLDINMPGLNGFEVCHQLKSNHVTAIIPVIFVTAMGEQVDEEHGLQVGAVDYITKPIQPSIVMARSRTHITLKQQTDKLRDMAIHDQLTGLYNRYYLLEIAEQKVSRANRNKEAFSLLIIDIDFFKKINDKYGHHQGDKVLQQVSARLQKKLRREDILTRYGGEEFIALLDDCKLPHAQQKAEQLRTIIENTVINAIKATVSIGVAEFRVKQENFSQLIERADAALYQAKAQGRNRVVVADSPET